MTEHVAPKGASDIVGDRIRQLRKERGLSVDDVAALCAAAGAPELTANALYSIESGRRKGGERTRKITVDELLALARALRVSPLGLIMPTAPAAYLITTESVSPNPAWVYDWFIGRALDPYSEPDPLLGVPLDGVPPGLPDYLAMRERQLLRNLPSDLEELMAVERTKILAAVAEANAKETEKRRADLEAQVQGVLRTIDESVAASDLTPEQRTVLKVVADAYNRIFDGGQQPGSDRDQP